MKTLRKNYLGLFVGLLILALLGGCATAPPQPQAPTAAHSLNALKANPDTTVQALLAQHQEWAGTPYRLGGTSRRGIDCSGFVQATYAARLGRSLPRTTEAQARMGRAVRRDEIIAGDLVFFRTGKKTRHVGVYIGEGHFVHASTSVGVTLSHLGNPYWANAYWTARRP